MRIAFASLLAASTLIGCATGEPVEPDALTLAGVDEQLPPPGAPLALAAGQFSAGSSVTITISNADPGENVYLIRSSAMGAGPCPGALGGMCVDVVAPVIMGPFGANGAGVATLSPTLPAGLPVGTEVCLQAIGRRGPGGVNSVKSPVLCRVSNNGPVSLEGGANTGDTFSNITTMGGPNLSFALKYTPTANFVFGYAEIFTGLGAGPNAISIWSHDAANNQPLAPIENGAWTMAANEEWQGAKLSGRVIAQPGVPLWIVWEPINGSRATRDLGGTNVDYRGSFTGGAPWNGPFTNFEKFKLCGGGGCP